MFRFVNEGFENTWGVARGYGIFHGMTTSQLLPDTHPLTRCAAALNPKSLNPKPYVVPVIGILERHLDVSEASL